MFKTFGTYYLDPDPDLIPDRHHIGKSDPDRHQDDAATTLAVYSHQCQSTVFLPYKHTYSKLSLSMNDTLPIPRLFSCRFILTTADDVSVLAGKSTESMLWFLFYSRYMCPPPRCNPGALSDGARAGEDDEVRAVPVHLQPEAGDGGPLHQQAQGLHTGHSPSIPGNIHPLPPTFPSAGCTFSPPANAADPNPHGSP